MTQEVVDGTRSLRVRGTGKPSCPRSAPRERETESKASNNMDTTPSPAQVNKNGTFQVLAAGYYILASPALTIFNKLLFKEHSTVPPSLLLICQSLTTLSIFSILRGFGYFQLPTLPISRAMLRSYIPMLICYALMLITSLTGLELTKALLMYNTIRRTSIVFVVTFHAILTRTYPTMPTIVATIFVVIGAIYASMNDLSFDGIGYSLAICANITTALYLILLRQVRNKLCYTNGQLLFVNTLFGFPLLILYHVYGYEWIVQARHHNQQRQTNDLTFFMEMIFSHVSNQSWFVLLFVASCGLATLVNHAVYVNTTWNDAVTQTICAQVKDVILMVVSYMIIDDDGDRRKGNIHGVLIGFVGSLIYAGGKIWKQTTGGERTKYVPANERGSKL